MTASDHVGESNREPALKIATYYRTILANSWGRTFSFSFALLLQQDRHATILLAASGIVAAVG
jgi:hypothetical protein